MLVDMHLHECRFSGDSFISLEEIVAVAKQKGLDAVCITDHDSMGLRAFAAEYAKKAGFPIFVGVEFFSFQGDITAWGLADCPPERMDAQPFLDMVNRVGGFSAACHPFRNNNRGLEERLRELKGLHGIEVYNGSTDAAANARALRFCLELGLQPIGASDAHTLEQIGKYATWLPEYVSTLEDFIEELRSRPTKAARWNGMGYDIMEV